MAFLNVRDVRNLTLVPRDVQFHILSRFLKGLRIHVHSGSARRKIRVIHGIAPRGGEHMFSKEHDGGVQISVAVRRNSLFYSQLTSS